MVASSTPKSMMTIMEKLKLITPWFLLTASLVALWWQNDEINGLKIRQKRQLSSTLRIDEEATILLPIFAQISKKHIRKVCLENFHSLKYNTKRGDVEYGARGGAEEKKRKSSTVKELRRQCQADVDFSQPVLVATRKNQEGCAFLDGIHWHVCEMSHGYTILSFKGNRQLNTSTTRAVQFLPYPFDGTDNTVINKTMWYSENHRIVGYNFKDESSQIINFQTSMQPLYFNSTSRLDIQAEEHGIWILYRRQDEKILTVSRMNPKTLMIVSNWTLPSIDPQSMCNSFIRCAVMFSVGCDGIVQPVYDFYNHSYVKGRQTQWKGIELPIGNVQYDPNSKSISIFANQSIFKVSIDQKIQI